MKDYSESGSACMSDDVRALAADMLRAKKEYHATGLDSNNPHFKSKYAKIDAIYDAVEKALNKYNILVTHYRGLVESRVFICTRLIHAPTGQWIHDWSYVESEKPGNQAHGSALTYMKRYALLNLCAIPQDEDDDGEEERKYIESLNRSDPYITESALQSIWTLLDHFDADKEEMVIKAILSNTNVKDLAHLRTSQVSWTINYITKCIEQAEKLKTK
jgi:hypothetical protein